MDSNHDSHIQNVMSCQLDDGVRSSLKGTRTHNLCIRSAVLFQLSYETMGGQLGFEPRSPASQASILTLKIKTPEPRTGVEPAT